MQKQIFKIFFLLTIFLLANVILATSSFAAEIIPDKDLVYLGAFRVANDMEGPNGAWFGYNSGFMTFNPYGNGGLGSIIATGQDAPASQVGEMSIPTPVIGPISSMNRATGLQPFADVRGSLAAIQTAAANGPNNNGQQTYGLAVLPPYGTQTTPKLYWASIYNYEPASSTTPDYLTGIGSSELNFSSPAAAGQWNLSGSYPAQYAWYALPIDKTWADTNVNGQYLGLGRDRGNSAGGQGWGPSLYTSAPWASGNPPADGTQLANKQLLGYTETNPLSKNYAHGDGSRGAAWVTINNKSAFVVAYNKGMRSASDSTLSLIGDYPFEDYKSGTQVGFPEMTGNGSYSYSAPQGDYKSYPWFGTLLFYDTDDLAAVAQGAKTPSSIHPYATFNIERYLKKLQGAVPSLDLSLGGIAFDPVSKRLYVQELLADGAYPIIHVFQLQDNGSTLPTVPPTIPNNVTNNGPNVSWSASVDSYGSSSSISYVVFKWFPAFISNVVGGSCVNIGGTQLGINSCSFPAMWRPVAGTTNTNWTDPGYVSGDRYNVTAYDAYMHPSNLLNTASDTTPPAAPSGLSVQ